MSYTNPHKTPYAHFHRVRWEHPVPYPFYLLTQSQRDWLRALSHERTRTLRDAFRVIGLHKHRPTTAVARWMDDPAFQEALFITLRQMDRHRAERVLDAIVRAVVCQPLRTVCDLSGRCC